MNEERLAYVEAGFPGWIQKVFADATYQYIRKGLPLFTIYSQDLVSTEQEFLLALKNKQTLTNSQTGTASEEADWLVDAARQRLRQWNVPENEIARMEKTGEVQREMQGKMMCGNERQEAVQPSREGSSCSAANEC